MIDETHAPDRTSWVASANGHPDFPIQNLPLCVFSPPGGGPRAGVAIGEAIFDLTSAHAAGLFHGEAARAAGAASAGLLNAMMAQGAGPRRALRARLTDLLDAGATVREGLLSAMAECTMHLPTAIGDYTDFYAGIHHALAVGRQFRPDSPLLPNYKYLPIGYHGRASSVVVSGTPVRRPHGQRKPAAETVPSFGPCRNLDYELELGVWVGPGNALGERVAIGEAGGRIAGFCLLNDWSARDIQGWEYQPLGPFLGKSFATTISPFVITPEALAPFRVAQTPRGPDDPPLLSYLFDPEDQDAGALDIALEVLLAPAGGKPVALSASNTSDLYWTVAQLLTHHASNGCNLQPGDLFGSGTISGPGPGGSGSLLELSDGGRRPLDLPFGQRRFLEDGDEVILRARGRRDGFASIGFGDCRGRVVG